MYVIYNITEDELEMIEIYHSKRNNEKLPDFYEKALLDVFSEEMIKRAEVDDMGSNIKSQD